jgi:uncharacterized protein (TIGR02246 family)
MKSMIQCSLVVLLFMSVNVFAQNDLSDLRSTFQQLQNQWNKAYISGDADALAGMYTDDAYSLPDKSPMWKGRDKILTENQKEMQSGVKYTNFTTKTLDVFGSGDVVNEIGTFSITYIPANSTESVTENGKYLDVWQKQSDGSWKLKADIWNSNTDPVNITRAGAKEKDKNKDKYKDFR